VVLRPHRALKLGERHRQQPPLIAPVVAHAAELGRLGSRRSPRDHNAHGAQHAVRIRVHDVARLGEAHVVVALVAGVVPVAVWRPQVVATNLMVAGLLVVGPPLGHLWVLRGSIA